MHIVTTWISSGLSSMPRFPITQASSCLLMNPFPSLNNSKCQDLIISANKYSIKNLKCFSNFIFCIFSICLQTHHRQELREVKTASSNLVYLANHVLYNDNDLHGTNGLCYPYSNFSIRRVLPDRSQDDTNTSTVNRSILLGYPK